MQFSGVCVHDVVRNGPKYSPQHSLFIALAPSPQPLAPALAPNNSGCGEYLGHLLTTSCTHTPENCIHEHVKAVAYMNTIFPTPGGFSTVHIHTWASGSYTKIRTHAQYYGAHHK